MKQKAEDHCLALQSIAESFWPILKCKQCYCCAAILEKKRQLHVGPICGGSAAEDTNDTGGAETLTLLFY